MCCAVPPFCVEMAVMQYSCLCYNYTKEDEKKAKRYKNSIKKNRKKRGIVYEERSLNKIKQMVSIGMSCIMAGSTCNLPMMLHAEEVQTENNCIQLIWLLHLMS